MLYCPICNAQVEDNASFCPSCGTPFVVQNNPGAAAQQPPVYNQQPPVYYTQENQQPPVYYTQENQQPATKPKKNKGAMIAIIAVVVLVLGAIGMFAEKYFQSQGYGDGDKEKQTTEATEKQKEEDKEAATATKPAADSTEATKPAAETVLTGNDVFQGQRYEEMLWGYYETTSYQHNSGKEDSAEFRTGMKYKSVKLKSGYEKDLSVLPVTIHFGYDSHFEGSVYYDGNYYEPYTEKGKAMFRKAYMEKVGDLTEEDFARIEKILNTNIAEMYLCEEDGSLTSAYLIYEIQGDQILFYEAEIGEDYSLIVNKDPILKCQFLHDGGTLTLVSQGVKRSYKAYGYNEGDGTLRFSGYALDAKNRYSDLEGIDFAKYEDGDTYLVVALSNGDKPVKPQMTLDTKTGNFTLSWEKCDKENEKGYLEEVDDPRTISGTIVPCVSYGFVDYSGFIMTVDGQQYRYQMSVEEYEERLEELAGGQELSDQQKNEINNAKRNLLEELVKAFNDAGIVASVDESTGKVSLEASFMFETGSYELSADGKEYLDKFMNVYTSVVMKEEYAAYISKIIVEGHTDTAGSYSTNLTLSKNRADAVKQQCISSNPKIANVIEAVGYAYDYPVYNEDGSVNMAASRRVTFSFVFAIK